MARATPGGIATLAACGMVTVGLFGWGAATLLDTRGALLYLVAAAAMLLAATWQIYVGASHLARASQETPA